MPKTENQPNTTWKPSNLEPILGVLPSDSHLRQSLLLFDRVLFALTETELKSAVLVHGLSVKPQTLHEIHGSMATTFNSSCWIPAYRTLNSYMMQDFVPLGLVQYTEGPAYRFSWTELGMQVGRPIAAALLKYTADNEIPFSSLLKKRVETKDNQRPYISRCAILLSLYHNPTHKADLMRKTGLDRSSTQEALYNLQHLGFIQYEFADTEVQGWSLYRRIGDPSEAVSVSPKSKTRRSIIEFFKSNETGNLQAIACALGYSENHTQPIKKPLSALVRDGFLIRPDWQGGVKQSWAEMNPKGEVFVENVLLPVLRFCAGDPDATRILQEILLEIKSNTAITSRAISCLIENRNPSSAKETGNSILALIQKEGPQRFNRITTEIGSRAEPVLDTLLKGGKLAKLRRGKAVFYYIPDSKKAPAKKRRYSKKIDQTERGNDNSTQKTMRKNLEVGNVEQIQRWGVLISLFKKYGQFDKTESERLKAITVDMVQAWLSNIRGHDVDDASSAAIGFTITKNQGVLAGMGFPAELRAAFLVYAFEQQRKGGSIPVPPKDDKGDYAFNNAEVKIVLQTLGFYLAHYQHEVRRKNPNAVLSVFSLISFLIKYIDSKAS